ncbi:(2Fe-2S) ferredoxin domain-containing protein [filamentous cyanobacterium LEGE 11480]|uniref:(2Fe-2S) ferredoxin domain-containing protein n=1 Tax=Romeriopsis navalis LEGE 11480 TaxID=2777977 RepID=A0A928VSW7_9CYAN|nr:(2Fe-2S) ferredoxin domain-containing protein [Romeriopsis navalis]MBE9031945.1 (2Fe-2S) ferredoxin domain-containing protein [Romeriopsis navalis LEGE 11480]
MSSSYEVLVCQGSSCLRQGSAQVLKTFETASEAHPQITPIACECQGQCNMSPTVLVNDETWYCRLKPEDVGTIVQQHFTDGEPVQALLHPRWHPNF